MGYQESESTTELVKKNLWALSNCVVDTAATASQFFGQTALLNRVITLTESHSWAIRGEALWVVSNALLMVKDEEMPARKLYEILEEHGEAIFPALHRNFIEFMENHVKETQLISNILSAFAHCLKLDMLPQAPTGEDSVAYTLGQLELPDSLE